MRRKLPRGISANTGGTYRVRISVDEQQHTIGTYSTIADAEAALAIARADKARGIFVPPAEHRRQRRERRALEQAHALTVSELADAWLDHLRRVGRAASTVVTHRSTLRVHVLPILGDVNVQAITPDMLQTMIDNITTPIPRRNAARTLQTLFNYAAKTGAGGIAVSPFQNITVTAPRPTTGRVDRDKIASLAEVEALSAAMPPELALTVPLAAWCCLRVGEVLGLARGDLTDLDRPDRANLRVERQVSPKANAITPPKADSYRTLAIPGFMLPMITAHLDKYVNQGVDAPMFPGGGVGGRVSQSAFDRIWRAGRDDVKPGFRFHDLRHSGLTHFAQAGATLAELMLRGGHTDVTVALKYQTATTARDRALTDRMQAALEGH